MFSAYALNPTT